MSLRWWEPSIRIASTPAYARRLRGDGRRVVIATFFAAESARPSPAEEQAVLTKAVARVR